MSTMLNPFSRADSDEESRALWEVCNVGKKRKNLAETGAERWKELAHLLHQQPSCCIIVIML